MEEKMINNISFQESIKIGKYTLIEKLGSGGFSSVYLCEDENHKKFALKKIREVKQRYIQQELDALMSIQSENIVKYVENFVYDEYPIIIMEYCEQGTLDQHLKTYQGGIMPEDKAIKMFCSILSGFRNIHEAGFIHRDLKLSNILMQDDLPKISDFGLAMKATSTQMIQSKSCTPTFAAPEVLQGKQYGYKVDIWSLGVILYKMVFGCIPFDGDSSQKLLKKIDTLCTGGFQISKAPKKKIQDISLGLIKLLKDIFVIDYKKRIGFKELYQNELIQNHFKDLQDNIQFYENIQTNDDLRMLQSQQQNINKNTENNGYAIGDGIENQEKFDKEDAMLTSILLQQKIQNPQQEEITRSYSACINQYSFLIDNYMFFNQKISTLYDVQNSLGLILLQKFFQCKLILYYISGLKQALDDSDNIFNLQVDWASFPHSKTYKQIHDRVKRDYQTWANEFQNLLFQVKQLKQDKYPSLCEYFNDELNLGDDYFEKIPDNLKLPFRAVTMTNLKNFYISIKENIAGREKFLSNKSNLKTEGKTPTQRGSFGKNTGQDTTTTTKTNNIKLSEPPQISFKRAMPNSFIFIEQNTKVNILLRLAMCAAWNRIFSVKNIYNLNHNKISYEQLIKIIHESDQHQGFKQTTQIMDTYFSNLKDFNYNFM